MGAAWAICEAGGWDDSFSMDRFPTEAPRFYGSFLLVVLIGVVVLQSGINVVALNVFIELMDGLLMPFAIGFLFLMACSDLLPAHARVTGNYKTLLAVMFSVCSVVSLGSGLWGLVRELREGLMGAGIS